MERQVVDLQHIVHLKQNDFFLYTVLACKALVIPCRNYGIFIDSEILRRHFVFQEESSGALRLQIMNNELLFLVCVWEPRCDLSVFTLFGWACKDSQISCQGAHGCNNYFSSPTLTKEALHSTSGVHGVSTLALTLGIGFMCEHAGFCVCLRREIHQK